ncbi:MAG: tRNA 2-thiouridine(34) synthase MnmA [Anaerolineae bacterium]
MTAKNDTDRRRVVVGLSGGVDSATAAALLQQEGYEVHAVALDTWRAPEAASDHLDRARAIAAHLGIPLTERDLNEAFYTRVVQPFIDAYAAGRTPNPCVFCNPILKFATLSDEADTLGARWVATGHYARVAHDNGSSHLLVARAKPKDQSYALYRLTQPILRRLLLPLGEMESKAGVRERAEQLGLPAAHADDSQDLCFVAGSYHTLLESLRPEALEPGPIFDREGRRLGEHSGLARYTIGQRKGLELSAPERLYVIALDPERNALIVGPRHALARTACLITALTFTAGHPPAEQFEATARIRYRAPLTPVSITLRDPTTADVHFSRPQYGVAPGQSLVIYQGEEVLGGGIIAKGNRQDLNPIRS